MGKTISFLVDGAVQPVCLLSLDGELLYVNSAFEKKIGFTKPNRIQDLLDVESIKLWQEFKDSLSQLNEPLVKAKINSPFKRFDGMLMQLKYLEEVQQIVALFEWPTWNHLAGYKPYAHAFNNSEDFMVIIDESGTIIEVNGLHNTFFKLPREYFLGNSYTVIVRLLNIDNETLLQQSEKANAHGHSEKIVNYQKSSDDLRHYCITTTQDKETGMFLLRMKDCTEEKMLERRLAHSDSLSAIGELAASIAHEIRNPMTTLKGFTQLLKLSASPDSLRYISVIEDEIERMDSILNEMLVLSKPNCTKSTILSLEVLLKDMIQIVRPKAIMEGISVLFQDSLLETSMILGDPDKLKQLLLNLFKNAFEAMTCGGLLKIQLGTDVRNNIVLAVTDTGKGMTINQINQLFMPFFTTKPEGTGLGLPFVLKTVEEHGGTISVESEPEKGTTFILSFPQAKKERQLIQNETSIR